MVMLLCTILLWNNCEVNYSSSLHTENVSPAANEINLHKILKMEILVTN
jgi:hypothetical protein